MHRTTLFIIAALAACDGGVPDADRNTAAADRTTVQAMAADTIQPAADSLVAVAHLRDTAGRAAGEVRLMQRGSVVVVHVEARRLAPGAHGIHVHETGACERGREAFASAGAHLNPRDVEHGLHAPSDGHAGDLPNIQIDEDGTGSLRFETAGLSIGTRAGEIFDRDGSALVIHADPDDQRTDPSGNSGARVACGVLTPA
ncbi:MAG TPA: superoxide dismutase family protein [Longimicrobiales bacterium]|nr:superoxide dismutase family protein [Longimicrobiales bacterium]